MSTSVLYMSKSLDGYIAGPNDNPNNPAATPSCVCMNGMGSSQRPPTPRGPAGARVFWTRSMRQGGARGPAHGGADRPLGRKSSRRADLCASHRPPDPSTEKYPLVNYVSDGIESAMAQAKTVAKDKNVTVHGAYTAQRAPEAGVLDELQIHQVPVLFGAGRRLFEMLPSRIELEIVGVIDTPEATHIRYRVRR